MREVAILYSGGSDSTAVAVLMSKKCERIHLLTYKHSGTFSIENSKSNVERLGIKYGTNKFVHKIFDVNKLFRYISFARYNNFLRKYGFMALSTCGCCKLAMHIRTLIYCLQNNISVVADGANRYMGHFPAQMPEVIAELRKLYGRYNIEYCNPVFDYECPKEEIDWFRRLRSEMPEFAWEEPRRNIARNTTSNLLFRESFYGIDNIKSKKINQKVQARCFQFVLFNIFLYWYFLPKYGEVEYKQITKRFFEEKIEYFSMLIEEYIQKQQQSKLYSCIEY